MNTTDPIVTHTLTAVWAGMLLGVVSGAVIGLFFHREDWMGGYGSFRRRLARLGHISFFGLALVNATFALTQHLTPLPASYAVTALWGFMIGAATMPTVCFLTAWRKPFRHLFFIPVGGVLIGIICVLIGR
jgi:hypothetical protein